jgi:hypothetical protein
MPSSDHRRYSRAAACATIALHPRYTCRCTLSAGDPEVIENPGFSPETPRRYRVRYTPRYTSRYRGREIACKLLKTQRATCSATPRYIALRYTPYLGGVA